MWRIETDGLAPTLNRFYSGTHWRAKNAWKDEYREAYWLAIKRAKLPKLPRITLSVTQFYTSHKRDVDSGVVAAKFFLDALVDAGCLPDDNPDHVASLLLRCEKGTAMKTVFIIQPYVPISS